MAKIGALIATLGLNTANFDSGIKKSGDSTNKFKKRAVTNFDKVTIAAKNMASKMGSIGVDIAKSGALMAIGYVAAQAAMVKAALNNIDALTKTADKLGITTEALSAFHHAADLAGVNNETFNKSIQKMGIAISEAATGTGLAKDSLEELNLSAFSLTKLPLPQQLGIIADALKGVESQTTKVRIASEIFGARGTDMLNMLAGGSEGLREMAEEAKHLGLSISRVDAAKIEAANDAVTRAKGVFQGFTNQLTIALSPLIETIANDIRGAAMDTADFGNVGQDMVDSMVKGYADIQDRLKSVSEFLMFASMRTLEFASSFLEVGAEINNVINPLDHLIRVFNTLLKMLGKDMIERPSEVLVSWAGDLEKAAADIEAVLNASLAKEPPSIGILQSFERIKVAAREAGEVVAAASSGNKAEDSAGEATNIVSIATWRDKLLESGAKKRADFDKKTAVEKTKYMIDNAIKESSALAANSKKAFAVQKAMKIALAIINTYESATQNLAAYPMPFGAIMAAISVANGLAQVAAIKSQSFDGGGFTGGGSRSGGVDGKGGFAAVLHPNETVIDHTKGQGMGGITIVNNIDATGAGSDVDLKIRAAMERASAGTVAQIQDLMKRRRFL